MNIWCLMKPFREALLDLPIERWTSETQKLLLRHGQSMEQTATNAFKTGIIDRRSYLLLTKGFSGDEASEGTDVDEAIISRRPLGIG